jgi:predicted nucleic acid-binding protein
MNGKAICNTGPIIALSMIDRIDVLRHLFELVAVPEAVHKEILEGGTTGW